MDIYRALGLRLVLTVPGGVDARERPPRFHVHVEAEGLRPDRQPYRHYVGSLSLRCGGLAEYYRATYEDVIAANQQQPQYQKAYLLHRVMLVDGLRISVNDVLAMDNSDVEHILKQVYAAMKR